MYVQIKIPPTPAYISYTPLQKSSALSAKETPCRAPSGTCSPKPCRLQCSARMQTIKPKTSKQTWSTSPSHPKPQPCSHMYVCIFINYTYIISIYTHVAYMTIITMTKYKYESKTKTRHNHHEDSISDNKHQFQCLDFPNTHGWKSSNFQNQTNQ